MRKLNFSLTSIITLLTIASSAKINPCYAEDASLVRLTNISTRANVGADLENMIAGFAISGSGNLKLIMRSLGQGLRNYGVPTDLDPQFEVVTYPARQFINNNDNWINNGSNIATELQSSQQSPPHNTDAATILTLPTGIYTTEVKPNSTAGVGLIEVFEAAGATGDARLINISTRSFVSSDLQKQIAGFGVVGNGTLKIAARAIGQGLVERGVPTNLNAKIQVYTYPARQLVGENDDWQSGTTANELTSKGYNPPHATDAALILNLTAGAYTVEVSPVDKPGIGLVELNELERSASSNPTDNAGSGNSDKWSQAHNTFRQKISDGTVNGQPKPSSPLPDMSSDATLAQVAKNYAAKCVWEHNANRSSDYSALGGSGYVGENLYAATGGEPSAATVVESWFNEYSDYNYSTNSCSNMCGHYTQIVWRNSVKVGCSSVFCPTVQGLSFSNAWLVVCNYAPGGNYNGEKPY